MADSKKQRTPEKIWLVPMAEDGELRYVWCDAPGMDAEDAIEYVRADVYEQQIEAMESEIKDKIAQNLALMRDRDAALEREKALAVKLPLDPTQEMVEAGAQALVQWACDGLVWPDSWSVLDVQSARKDAEKAYRAMVWNWQQAKGRQ